jgi:nucleoid-associated protein YgaU
MTNERNDVFEEATTDEVSGKIDGLDEAMNTEVLEEETLGPVDVADSNDAESYTVAEGDNLRTIAQRFYGNAADYVRIIEANREELRDSETVRPGLRLRIPR